MFGRSVYVSLCCFMAALYLVLAAAAGHELILMTQEVFGLEWPSWLCIIVIDAGVCGMFMAVTLLSVAWLDKLLRPHRED